MNIKEFSFNLQNLYEEMSESFSAFQRKLGYNCLPACGRCCLNPEVDASLYEMLPMALAIWEEGKLDEWVERLQTTHQKHCLVWVPGAQEGEGKCGRYKERPSICRMFGVSGYRNKQNEVTLSICKFIKEQHNIQGNPLSPVSREETPMMVEWSYKLASLDQRLVQEKMPINEALLKALEKVALYAQYQSTEPSAS